MEVRIGEFNVTQGGHLVVEAIGIFTGHSGTTIARTLVRLYNTHLLEGITPHGRAVMAGGTTTALKQLITLEFLGGDGILVTTQPLVETRVRRDQRFFKGGNGLGHFVDGDLVGTKDFLELVHIARDGR